MYELHHLNPEEKAIKEFIVQDKIKAMVQKFMLLVLSPKSATRDDFMSIRFVNCI
jgi:hypothetical protein